MNWSAWSASLKFVIRLVLYICIIVGGIHLFSGLMDLALVQVLHKTATDAAHTKAFIWHSFFFMLAGIMGLMAYEILEKWRGFPN